MERSVFLHALILLSGVFIGAISQVILKKAALKKYDSFLQEYLNPRVIFAYILFVGTTFLSIWAYRGIPLNLGPVLETTSYLYITFFGIIIFHERLSKQKALALILIVAGVLIYSL